MAMNNHSPSAGQDLCADRCSCSSFSESGAVPGVVPESLQENESLPKAYSQATLKPGMNDNPLSEAAPVQKVRVIVNPRSSSGKTNRKWSHIASILKEYMEDFDYVFTEAPMDACTLTRVALKEGVEQIIAVGGDGTLNEVVNGFFENGEPINPQAVLSYISSGTGSDFRRSFSTSRKFREQIRRVVEGEVRSLDLGRVSYFDDEAGESRSRYFINAASCGLSGATCRAVNGLRLLKKLGGKIAFQWGVISTLFQYRNIDVRLQVDDSFDEILAVNTVAVCNGRFFGSGMNIAPEASLDDGLFDIIVIRKLSLFQIIKWFPLIYKGTHLKKKELVLMLRGEQVRIDRIQEGAEALIEIDGESPGRLPAVYDIVPAAILVKN